jgi:hypothetical protein
VVLHGLRDKGRSGRPPIFNDQDHERLQELVYQTTSESVTTETVIAAFDHFIA